MRQFFRHWLGIDDLENTHGRHLANLALKVGAVDEQLAELIAQRERELLAPVDAVEAEADQAPGVVDSVVNYWWKESPQAAATTRTYARAMLALGASPETVARRVMESGVTVE
jgi:hypothetical protein